LISRNATFYTFDALSDLSAEIGIIGGGPAGAHLASRLAASGREVIIFDPKGAWEKPCGGGVPTRAIREFGFLLEASSYPNKLVRRVTIISPLERRVTIQLERPFAIYSREVLNSLILDRAVEAGAEFVRNAVVDFAREGSGWKLTADDGRPFRIRFLVGADGAASFTRRRLIGIFPKQDLALAFGYNVNEPIGSNGHAEEVIVRFPRDFTGYLWAFPRVGVMNFGVASKLGERTSDELRRLLGGFVQDYYGGRPPDAARMSFFGAKIPTLDVRSWPGLKASGEGWALVGDAAGFADPITGEGIYYALKSADLCADALLGNGHLGCGRGHETAGMSHLDEPPSDSPQYSEATARYEHLWRDSFGRDLEHASYRLPRFYRGTFFGHIFTDAMVALARHHRGVRTILERALMGEQSYLTLKRDLIRRAFQFF